MGSSGTEQGIIGVSVNNSSCSFSYSVSPAASYWLSVSRSPTNPNRLIVQCSQNNTGSSRTGNIYVDSYTVAVTQCRSLGQVGTISGASSVCANTEVIYSIGSVSGAESYYWSVSNGSVISGQGTTSATMKFTEGGSSTVYVSAKNSCGGNSSNSINVNVTALPSPGAISGKTTICANSTNNYSISPVSGASSYIWTLPSGASGYSTTSSIDLSMDSGGGFITVVAKEGSCTSTPSKLYISVPSAVAYTVTGGGTICEGATTSITLNGSSSGLRYKAYCNGSPLESTQQQGTGNPLVFSGLGTAGTYTVYAIDQATGCAIPMNGSVTISYYERPGSTLSGSATICSGSSADLKVTLKGTSPWELTYTDGISYNTISNISTNNYNIPVTPGSTKTYSLTKVLDGRGCYAVSSGMTGNAVISVNSRPTSIIEGSSTVCAGEGAEVRVYLSGTSPWNFTYSNGVSSVPVTTSSSPYKINVVPSATATYTVTALSDKNCSSVLGDRTGVATLDVTPLPSPLPVVQQPYVIAFNTPGDLIANGANATSEGYHWYTSSTGGSPLSGSKTPNLTANTNYYVTKYSKVFQCESKPRVTYTVTVDKLPV
ncbi:MAG TPA: BACON domain-containing carbohydrate-binding protein, partial [Bacteroidales bacterium]|nr:BACON domain-containing carbohydrate-binding protein [Bacteroidales bacterium]